MIYLEVRKIYQPGYSGGRGERQKIYLVLEYELSSVAAILCVTVRPERTPQENLILEGGVEHGGGSGGGRAAGSRDRYPSVGRW